MHSSCKITVHVTAITCLIPLSTYQTNICTNKSMIILCDSDSRSKITSDVAIYDINIETFSSHGSQIPVS